MKKRYIFGALTLAAYVSLKVTCKKTFNAEIGGVKHKCIDKKISN